jgi:hypothetical protein
MILISARDTVDGVSRQAGTTHTPVPLVPHATPCRRAGCPAALTLAVEAALAHQHPICIKLKNAQEGRFCIMWT